jgi:hypothetical protein
LGAYFYVDHLVLYRWPYTQRLRSPEWLIDQIKIEMDAALVAWHRVRYGGTTEGGLPFARFSEVLVANLQTQEQTECPDRRRIVNNYSDARRCIPSELQFNVFQPTIMAKLLPYEEGLNDTLVLNQTENREFISLWYMLISPLWDKLFMPMFESITPHIEDTTNSILIETTIIAVVLVVCGVISETISSLQLSSMTIFELCLNCCCAFQSMLSNRFRKLFKHCPVTSHRRIEKVRTEQRNF